MQTAVLLLKFNHNFVYIFSETIPSAPRNPVLIVSSRNIELYWEKPIQNPDKVQNYMIMYGYQGAKQKNITTVSLHKTKNI